MVALSEDETIQILHIVKETRVAAPLDITFEALIAEMGDEGQMPDGTPMPMKLEPGRADGGTAIWATTWATSGVTCR